MYVYFKNRQKQYVLGKICFKTVFVFVISKHHKRDWNTVSRIFALHLVSLGSIPGAPEYHQE